MLLTSVRCHITASHYKKYRCRYTFKSQKIAVFKTNKQIKLALIRVPFFRDNSLSFSMVLYIFINMKKPHSKKVIQGNP